MPFTDIIHHIGERHMHQEGCGTDHRWGDARLFGEYRERPQTAEHTGRSFIAARRVGNASISMLTASKTGNITPRLRYTGHDDISVEMSDFPERIIRQAASEANNNVPPSSACQWSRLAIICAVSFQVVVPVPLIKPAHLLQAREGIQFRARRIATYGGCTTG